MAEIDKRTGEKFPSIAYLEAQNALFNLPEMSVENSWEARVYKTFGDKLDALWNTRINWTLVLDPHTLIGDYGAFQELDRPVEWFIACGQEIQGALEGDEALWQAINNVFDRAIVATDESVLGGTPND